jgi:hypothetical protein
MNQIHYKRVSGREKRLVPANDNRINLWYNDDGEINNDIPCIDKSRYVPSNLLYGNLKLSHLGTDMHITIDYTGDMLQLHSDTGFTIGYIINSIIEKCQNYFGEACYEFGLDELSKNRNETIWFASLSH